MREYTVFEIRVSRDRFLSPNVPKLHQEAVHLSLGAVQHRDLQGIIMIRVPGSDELHSDPQLLPQRSQTGSAREAGIGDGLAVPEQFSQFSLKEVHWAPSFRLSSRW